MTNTSKSHGPFWAFVTIIVALIGAYAARPEIFDPLLKIFDPEIVPNELLSIPFAEIDFSTSNKTDGEEGIARIGNGMMQKGFADGWTQGGNKGGRDCLLTKQNPAEGAQYIYFDIDDALITVEESDIKVVIEYFDEEPDSGFGVEYDSTEFEREDEGWWTPAKVDGSQEEQVFFMNTREWSEATFSLPHAYFRTRQHNTFSDFRIGTAANVRLCIRTVRLYLDS